MHAMKFRPTTLVVALQLGILACGSRVMLRQNLVILFPPTFATRGSSKFLDAYEKFDVGQGIMVQANQFRIPFGIDPFRGSGNYIFADRSFIGRDIDNIRADGVLASYTFQNSIPVVVTLGVFSPNSITD